eukprot:CAMPEP_0194216578 /NCGR_PEP_ID=MMETSP0156-20130528/19268_1 /TAXON_ID=33649 /ORGANISM="Thalassionema nitzschioides, Strain L26-B" /LENGTH=282 /DNA_ID=CAMNT_0038945379 /DNA_START=125 /DNA_END=973 /DNA_ORIENTATION=+
MTTTEEKENDSLNLSSLASALESTVKAEDINYSDEELETMREVKRLLEEEDGLSYVNPRFLAYTVIVCKNRVQDSVDKYRKFLKAMSACGDGSLTNVETDDEMWNDPHVVSFLRKYYVPCGVDFEGRQILWIYGGEPITEEMELTCVRAGILYTAAVHADNKSLREGITFVIDTSKQGSKEKIGNESKLQKLNQSYPLRPQAIYLAGSSYATRLLINGLIRIASVFTKQKILQRIKFVTMEEAVELVPKESAPRYAGGEGGNISDVFEWAKKRYAALPIPDL